MAVAAVLLIAGCYSGQPGAVPGPTATPSLPLHPSESQKVSGTTEAARPAATPTSIWLSLHQRTPYPYTTPLPPPTPTVLDGTYAKFEPKGATPVHCLRCPDYALEGGVWKLSLDKGISRIYHQVTGWRSMGSFIVSGDQLTLANDPTCPSSVGTYRWQLREGNLILQEIDDECAIRLRAMNLTNLPWLSCRPPSAEAGVTDHWPKPRGCE